jgi:hypothetical protein
VKPPRRRYLGSWVLPSGNSCDAYITPDHALMCEWDTPPSSGWPDEDFEHWKSITFPELIRVIAIATGRRVLGVSL